MKRRAALANLALFCAATVAGCTEDPTCPTCGTTQNGTVGIIDIIPVPEHNPTGEPGGPFNSFDDSWIDSPPSGGVAGTDNLDYVSDRIGVAVQVVDTNSDLAVYSIAGQNGVSGG